MADDIRTRRIQGYCGLCIARCGTIATVEGGLTPPIVVASVRTTAGLRCAKPNENRLRQDRNDLFGDPATRSTHRRPDSWGPR